MPETKMRKANDSTLQYGLKSPPNDVSGKSGDALKTTIRGAVESAQTPLVIIPIKLHTARAFIAWTSQDALPQHGGATLALGVSTAEGVLVGVALAGHPAIDALDDGHTIEIWLAADGTPGACPALICAGWQIAQVTGYHRLITYTCAAEPGSSPPDDARRDRRRVGPGAAPAAGRAR
ncbi:XF1762 family protein [Sphaerisporangium sp. NPDC049003]|uniref:XF1762 family protein n=1 Tax=Sphaerisporangium sp. NPDC049003 TaxID=3364517 RepID=UPI0037223A18